MPASTLYLKCFRLTPSMKFRKQSSVNLHVIKFKRKIQIAGVPFLSRNQKSASSLKSCFVSQSLFLHTVQLQFWPRALVWKSLFYSWVWFKWIHYFTNLLTTGRRTWTAVLLRRMWNWIRTYWWSIYRSVVWSAPHPTVSKSLQYFGSYYVFVYKAQCGGNRFWDMWSDIYLLPVKSYAVIAGAALTVALFVWQLNYKIIKSLWGRSLAH